MKQGNHVVPFMEMVDNEIKFPTQLTTTLGCSYSQKLKHNDSNYTIVIMAIHPNLRRITSKGLVASPRGTDESLPRDEGQKEIQDPPPCTVG